MRQISHRILINSSTCVQPVLYITVLLLTLRKFRRNTKQTDSAFRFICVLELSKSSLFTSLPSFNGSFLPHSNLKKHLIVSSLPPHPTSNFLLHLSNGPHHQTNYFAIIQPISVLRNSDDERYFSFYNFSQWDFNETVGISEPVPQKEWDPDSEVKWGCGRPPSMTNPIHISRFLRKGYS